jgi:hypothetical protein
MFSRVWLINLFLTIFIIFFGIKAYGVWSERERVPSETRPVRKPLPLPGKNIVINNMPPESDYEVIVSNNPFMPDRGKPAEGKQHPGKKVTPKIDKKLLRRLNAALRRTVVYGVIIAGEYKKALVTTVESRPTRGRKRKRIPAPKRRARWVKVGDSLGEFTVDDIRKGSVLLAAAGNQYRVFLYDREKPKRRVPVKGKENPTVVSLGSKTATIPEVAKATPKRVSQGQTFPKEIPKSKVSKQRQPPKRIVRATKSPSNKVNPDRLDGPPKSAGPTKSKNPFESHGN